ncbi:MAG: ABC transporter substrate-binding protein [Nitrospirae bacterium]|nr:ABC transporter substrate-binding protein [Nitrospirota bacterium]
MSETEITLGMSNAQTGPASGLGKGMLTGADAYFKDINEKGGIHGRKIKLVVKDDGYEPEKAIDSTLSLIEDEKVFALFGYVGTPTANAVIPLVKDANIPLVGLFTGAMTLRNPVTKEIVNVRASYDDETEVLVDRFIKDTGAKKFSVLYQNDGFGLAVLSGTEKALKKRGMEVVGRGSFQRNTVAINEGFTAIKDASPDAVVLVGPYAPIAAIIKLAKQEKLPAKLATVSFVGTDNLVSAVGGEGEGVVISQVVPFPDDTAIPVVKECADAMKKYYPDQKLGFINLEGCITAKVMAFALEKGGKDLTREGLIGTLENIKGVDIGGVSINMGPDDHQALDNVFLTQIKDGRITQIKTIGK